MNFSTMCVDFLHAQKISNEAFTKLEIFIDLIIKWNSKINLVSRQLSPEQIWEHIWDSLQLIPYLQQNEKVVDVGSGAGFPAIVLAICGYENLYSVECSQKKAMFQQEAVNNLALTNIEIINKKIEEINDLEINTIVSRATFSIRDLIIHCEKLLPQNPRFLMLKTKTQKKELVKLQAEYTFKLKIYENSYKQNKVVYEIYCIKKI